MSAKRFFPVLALCAAIGLIGLGIGGCGDDDDGNGNGAAATTEETTAEDTTAESEAGEGSGGNARAPSGDAVRSAKVEIEDFAYEPDPVTIEEGGKVIWINRDSEPHTATAEDGSFDTGTLEEGKLKSESFNEPGAYAYVCTIHPEMKGAVEVVEAG
jgi:plastocyanin